jgi:hypothetical protein
MHQVAKAGIGAEGVEVLSDQHRFIYWQLSLSLHPIAQ